MSKTFVKAEMKHMTAWFAVIMVVIIYSIGWYLYLWPTIPLPGIKDGWINFFEWVIWTMFWWYVFWYLISLEESYRIESLAARNAMKKSAGLFEKPKEEKKKTLDELVAEAVKAKAEEGGGEK